MRSGGFGIVTPGSGMGCAANDPSERRPRGRRWAVELVDLGEDGPSRLELSSHGALAEAEAAFESELRRGWGGFPALIALVERASGAPPGQLRAQAPGGGG